MPKLDAGMKEALKKKLKTKIAKTEYTTAADVSEMLTHEHEVIIGCFNGKQGSGKSEAAYLFPNPLILDLESFKSQDLIKHTPRLRELDLLKNIRPALVINLETGETDEDASFYKIKEICDWFVTEGYKHFDAIVFDSTKKIRDFSITVERNILGRENMLQREYGPVNKRVKKMLFSMIAFCRLHGKHFVIITHWEPDYIRGEGRIPDVKEWMTDEVSWIIDFLKPEESGYEGKYIAYISKSPVKQYVYLDITDKNLAEIITDEELYYQEIENFKKLEKKKAIAEKKAGAKK